MNRGFSWIGTLIFGLGLIAMLAGCSAFHDQYAPQLVPVYVGAPGTGMTAAGAAVLVPADDYHLVMVRPQPGPQTPIICTEPSPDYATALGNAVGVTASGGVASGPSASLAANESSTEAITALLGRTAGVVALRDGLYSACQAYANGVIGRDAYGLIISQYGFLLTQLATGGASGSTPAASSSSAATGAPASVSVQIAGAAAAPAAASAQQNTAGGGAQSQPNAQVAIMQQQAIQAMLVSCITDQDPSEGQNSEAAAYPSSTGDEADTIPLLGGRSRLLADYCKPFMAGLIKEEPALLTPQPMTAAKTQTAGAAAEAPKPVAAVAAQPNPVNALQEILAQDGDYTMPPSGNYDVATQAAVIAYEQKHNTPP